MSTKKTRIKAIQQRETLADRVQKWSGDFEEEKQVIFELIVAYCNGTNIWDSEAADIKELKRVGFAGLGGRGRTDGLQAAAMLLHTVSYMHFPKGVGEQEAVAELKAAHSDFYAAVRWLCSPKNPIPAASPEELKQLQGEQKLEWGRFPDVDETSETFIEYFETHGVKHFQKQLALGNSDRQPLENSEILALANNDPRALENAERRARDRSKLILFMRPLHVIDLFCSFLVNECRDREPASMPIKICGQCHEMFSACELEGEARTRKLYCSAKCRSSSFWTRERRSDYRYVERLDPDPDSGTGMYSRPDLRKRLQNPKVEQRLRQIEARWPDWQTIQDKLARLRAFQRPR